MLQGLHFPLQPLFDVMLQTIDSVGPMFYVYFGASLGIFVLGGLVKIFRSKREGR